jgi:acetyl esterase/lipase
MRLDQRLLSAFLAVCLFSSSIPAADEPKSETPAPAKKSEAPRIPPGMDYLPDQLYCTPDKDTKLMADLVLPKNTKGPLPAVVCLHGGGWFKGNRTTNLPIMIKLAEAGYVAVSVQYRLAPKDPFPAAVHDVKCAVRWLRANAGVFNIDPDHIAVLGYSSGAQLACLLGLTTPLDGLEGDGGFPTFSSRVQAVVSYYGISDLAQWQKDNGLAASFCVNRFLNASPDKAPNLCSKASPISYACGDLAGVFLIHGTKDSLVSIKQSERLEKSLKKAGAKVQLLPIDGGDHAFTGELEDQADAAAIKYLDEVLRSKEAAKAAGRREP